MYKNAPTIPDIPQNPDTSPFDSNKATLHCYRYDQGLIRIAQAGEEDAATNGITNIRQCAELALGQNTTPNAEVLLIDLDYPTAPKFLEAQMEVIRRIRKKCEASLGLRSDPEIGIKLKQERFAEDIRHLEGMDGANIRNFLRELKGKISDKEVGVILKQLGAGGMSKIHECLMADKANGKIYAAKFQNNEQGGVSASLLTPEFMDALASTTGQSGRLVTYHHSLIDRTGGKKRRVDMMELFDGSINLVHYLERHRESRIPLGILLEKIFLPVLEAVRDLHQGNVVHRDPKPQNFLVRQNDSHDFGDCELKLNDFDLSCLEGYGLNLQNCGTIEFMSNEQCVGKPVTRKTDIYNLGMMLFYFAGGEKIHIPAAMSVDKIAESRLSKLKAPEIIKNIIAECVRGEAEGRPDIHELISKIKNAVHICGQKESQDARNMPDWHIGMTRTVLPDEPQAEELHRLYSTLGSTLQNQCTVLDPEAE